MLWVLLDVVVVLVGVLFVVVIARNEVWGALTRLRRLQADATGRSRALRADARSAAQRLSDQGVQQTSGYQAGYAAGYAAARAQFEPTPAACR